MTGSNEEICLAVKWAIDIFSNWKSLLLNGVRGFDSGAGYTRLWKFSSSLSNFASKLSREGVVPAVWVIMIF